MNKCIYDTNGKMLISYEEGKLIECLENAVKSDIPLKNLNLRLANLKGVKLNGADLECANLSGADLEGANLKGSNLKGANLKEANLKGANLNEANISGADLADADLEGAKLEWALLDGANLFGTNFNGANLNYASISRANLSMAVLARAKLTWAKLNHANLKGADLRGANINGAYLYMADLNGAKNIPFIPLSCPSEGAFIGWKKVNNEYLVKIQIPEDARRLSATTRKCRCDKAMVLEITSLDGKEHYDDVTNNNYNETIYKVGEMVYPDSFDENRWNECSHEIHFFVNKEDAINY